jgi:RNA polymerase sigma factor (sigma-70 family)
MHDRDSDLARRCQGGDATAYAELVRRHRRMVYRIARGIVGSADEAEDVVQDAFVRAFRRTGTHRRRQTFAGWVRRIALNCAIDHIRRRERERRNHEQAPRNPGPTRDPAEEVMATEVRTWARRAVEDLPLKQRLAVTLFYLDDLSVAETAETLGCSPSTVKVHLTRGRRRLAERMADRFEEG